MSFESAYEAHRHRVFRWALRYGGGDTGWAEDVTHDVFVKLLKRLPTLERHEDLGGWLYRVTANLAISRIRREQSIFGRVLRLYGAGRREMEQSVQTLFEGRESAARALEALGSLPPRERVAMSMVVLDGKSQREVAQALSLSEGYVSKLLSRAWARLKEAGWEVDDAGA